MQDKNSHPSWLEVFKSVLIAMIGVQSRRIHERDFTQGRPGPYIFASIVVITLLVLTLIGLVRLILYLANS